MEMAEFLSREKGVRILDSKKKEINEYPISKNIPNEETLRAMEKTSKGIDVFTAKNHKDLMKKLLK